MAIPDLPFAVDDPIASMVGEIMNAGVVISNVEVLLNRLRASDDWQQEFGRMAERGRIFGITMAWRHHKPVLTPRQVGDLMQRYGCSLEVAHQFVRNLKVDRVDTLPYTHEDA